MTAINLQGNAFDSMIATAESTFKEEVKKIFSGKESLQPIVAPKKCQSPNKGILRKTLDAQVLTSFFSDFASQTCSSIAHRHFYNKITNHLKHITGQSANVAAETEPGIDIQTLTIKIAKHYEASRQSFLTCAGSTKKFIEEKTYMLCDEQEIQFINNFIEQLNLTLKSARDDTFQISHFFTIPSDDELHERFEFLNNWFTSIAATSKSLETQRASKQYQSEIQKLKTDNQNNPSRLRVLNNLDLVVERTENGIKDALAQMQMIQKLSPSSKEALPSQQKKNLTPLKEAPAPLKETRAPLKGISTTFKLARHPFSAEQIKTLESYLPYSHFPSTQNKGFSQVDLFMESCALRLEANNPQELKYFLPASTKNGSEIVFGAFIYEINDSQTIAKKKFVKEGDLGDLVTCAEFSEFKSNNLEYPVTENRLAQPGPCGTIAINFQGNDTLLYVNRA